MVTVERKKIPLKKKKPPTEPGSGRSGDLPRPVGVRWGGVHDICQREDSGKSAQALQ